MVLYPHGNPTESFKCISSTKMKRRLYHNDAFLMGHEPHFFVDHDPNTERWDTQENVPNFQFSTFSSEVVINGYLILLIELYADFKFQQESTFIIQAHWLKSMPSGSFHLFISHYFLKCMTYFFGDKYVT